MRIQLSKQIGFASTAISFFLMQAYAQAQTLQVQVSHQLEQARQSETITIPWSQVNAYLPGALIQKIAVKDKNGKVLAHQVTNIAPQAKDPKGIGIAYGELIFQYHFAAGEKTAQFTVEQIDTVAPVFETKAFGRHVPERLDDFAWENDKVAHRTYGLALAAPAPAGVVKEVLVTSGIDVWFKRVNYPIVDRWYNKGHDHYHKDEGEGMDMYNVGKSRGCGGTGIWDGQQLHTSINYEKWKVLANGPVRTVFELSYQSWDAAGVAITETKRFTVDAGHYLDKIETTFHYAGEQTLNAAIGLNKTPSDKGQDPHITLIQDASRGVLAQWVQQTSKGDFGTAVILPSASGYTEDTLNHLILAPVQSGKSLTYYAGAAWNRSGDILSKEAWQDYLNKMAQRYRDPIQIRLSAKTP
jgi:pectinesterase